MIEDASCIRLHLASLLHPITGGVITVLMFDLVLVAYVFYRFVVIVFVIILLDFLHVEGFPFFICFLCLYLIFFSAFILGLFLSLPQSLFWRFMPHLRFIAFYSLTLVSEFTYSLLPFSTLCIFNFCLLQEPLSGPCHLFLQFSYFSSWFYVMCSWILNVSDFRS